MCQLDPKQLDFLVRSAAAHTGAVVAASEVAVPSTGSRRRRIWELSDQAHCPVIGVGLPLATLRRIVDKSLGGQAQADDYELHCGAVAACKHRTSLAEVVQRELDQRHAVSLRHAARIKTTEALEAWWDAASLDHLAGVFWATLTHARCTSELEHKVLGRVHMIQHQVGAVARTDMQRAEALLDENAVLTRALATAQHRCTQLAEEHARHQDAQHGQLLQLRADLIRQESSNIALREELQALEAAIPGLQARTELARQCARHLERIHQLERHLLRAQQDAERQRRRADESVSCVTPVAGSELVPTPATEDAPSLQDRAVLCVGGRQSSVPVYRRLIEQAGGHFLHHDGGEEENVARLESTLAAADLVICQTGCISHGAYWRVKDHCKRTGKRCVFVENPSASSLMRGLGLGAVVPAEKAD